MLKPRAKPRASIGLVERLARHLGRGRLVHPQRLGEAGRHLRRSLHHHIAPNLILVVAEAVGKCRPVVEFSNSRGVSIE